MGTDQGKLGNMHALGIIADTAGVKMGELGTTTLRPPYTPLTFGTIVGRNVVVPNSPILTPAVSAIIPNACIFPSLP